MREQRRNAAERSGKARRLDEDLGASEAKQSRNRKEKNQTNDTQVPSLRSYLEIDRKRDTNRTDFHEWDFETGGPRKRSDGRKMGGRKMGSTGGNGENGVVAKR
jgi:hypothetical protein